MLELLKDKGPLTSTEIQKEFDDKQKPFVRAKLSLLFKHGHLVRSHFETRQGYIYALPFDKDKMVEKLKQIVPGYVRHSLELLMRHEKMFSLNQLVEN